MLCPKKFKLPVEIHIHDKEIDFNQVIEKFEHRFCQCEKDKCAWWIDITTEDGKGARFTGCSMRFINTFLVEATKWLKEIAFKLVDIQYPKK